MRRVIPRLLLAALSLALFSTAAQADDLPVGIVSYDVTGTNVAEFDILNFTGPNASTYPDTTFPIATPLSLSGLSLTVGFSDGTSVTYGPSYFTLSSDGLSFNGDQLSTLSGPPTGLYGADSATLTGILSENVVTLNDGSMQPIVDEFSATISDPSGLSDGDFAVIVATTPEPSSWILLITGFLAFGAYRLRVWKLLQNRSSSTIALGVGLLFLLHGSLQAQTTVRLNASASNENLAHGVARLLKLTVPATAAICIDEQLASNIALSIGNTNEIYLACLHLQADMSAV